MNEFIIPLIYGILALVFGALISFVLTPIIRLLAFKVKAIDIPKDDRRMHSVAIPRLGGLAIFIAFELGVLIFCVLEKQVLGLLIGTLLIASLGILDDIYNLSPWVKLGFQIIASFVPITFGNVIEHITVFGKVIEFGAFSIPVTVIWIVALTNAVNLIDGLDGLACGISTISAAAILILTIMESEPQVALIAAILTGACLGFMPFNFNPAKIFMGDTGALTLGFVLSVLSVQGLFKMQAMVSFWVPFLIFALPFVDTLVAIVRRLLKGQSPFHADRGHLHHKLVDLGLTQKQSVIILYAISGILAIASIVYNKSPLRSGVVIVVAIVLGLLNFQIFKNSSNMQSIQDMDNSCIKDHIPVPGELSVDNKDDK